MDLIVLFLLPLVPPVLLLLAWLSFIAGTASAPLRDLEWLVFQKRVGAFARTAQRFRKGRTRVAAQAPPQAAGYVLEKNAELYQRLS